jgi:hypothetical protein
VAPPRLQLVAPEVGRPVRLGELDQAVDAGQPPVVLTAPVDPARGLLTDEDRDVLGSNARSDPVRERILGVERRPRGQPAAATVRSNETTRAASRKTSTWYAPADMGMLAWPYGETAWRDVPSLQGRSIR